MGTPEVVKCPHLKKFGKRFALHVARKLTFFLLFIRFLPVLAIAEIKELEIHERVHGEGAH